MENKDFNEIELEINSLLKDYLVLFDAINKEPVFTLINYFKLFLKVFFWEVFLLLLPITSGINLVIFLVNRIKKDKIKYVNNYFIKYSREAIEDVQNGNISLFAWCVFRYFTKVFVTVHVRNRVEDLQYLLQRLEVESYLFYRNEEIDGQIKKCKEFLGKYLETLEKGIQIKLLLLISPYVLFMLDWAFKLFKPNIDINKLSITQFDSQILITLILLFFMIITSSHIRKRQLLSNRDIYLREYIVFSRFHAKPSLEFPFDLIGWILIFVLNFIPLLIYFSNQGYGEDFEEFLQQLINTFIIIALVLGYVFFRRVKLFTRIERIVSCR